MAKEGRHLSSLRKPLILVGCARCSNIGAKMVLLAVDTRSSASMRATVACFWFSFVQPEHKLRLAVHSIGLGIMPWICKTRHFDLKHLCCTGGRGLGVGLISVARVESLVVASLCDRAAAACCLLKSSNESFTVASIMWMMFCIVIGRKRKALISLSSSTLNVSTSWFRFFSLLAYRCSSRRIGLGNKPRNPTSVIVAVAMSNSSSSRK